MKLEPNLKKYKFNEEITEKKELENKFFDQEFIFDFIDDRNIGGFVGWSKVWELLCPSVPDHIAEKKLLNQYKKRNFLQRLFSSLLQRLWHSTK